MAATPTCNSRVILGPPGTGKTTRLISVARELCPREEESEVLFVSHTVAAARELGKRCGMPKAATRTLHSVCFELLGLGGDQVVGPGKLASFAALLSLDIDEDTWASEALAVQAVAECSGKTLLEAYMVSGRTVAWPDVAYVCDAYSRWKKQNGFCDFTDMLVRAANRGIESRWSRLFLDEAQDFSPAAWRVVEHLIRNAQSVVVAGDDDQAIYEWSGADPHGIDAFASAHGSSVEVLDRSYRVPRAVHRVAQQVASRLTKRIRKAYDPDDRDGTFRYVGTVDTLTKADLKGAVILYRDKSQRTDIDEHLTDSGVAYTYGKPNSPSPYDRREARAVRLIAKLRAGRDINSNEMKALTSVIRPDIMGRFKAKGVIAFDTTRPSDLFDHDGYYSTEVLEYLDRVDVTQPPEVTVSTIHGYKGAENSRIILCTGMSDRISTALTNNPDPEHRVWYVGVTRTRDDLIAVGGENEYTL